MPNIKQTIDGYNKSILMKFDKPKTDECNCRKRKELMPTPRPMPHEVDYISSYSNH